MRKYIPNERIVDKVAALWVAMLSAPKYDNGDRSAVGGMATAMAMVVPRNNTPEILEAFGKHLKEALTTPNEQGYYKTYTGVDYNPDGTLSRAAEKAGLKMQFPWKTSINFWTDHIAVSAGYGAEGDCYYPLKDGRWLITTLRGSDIEKVIELVEGGIPEFRVEA